MLLQLALLSQFDGAAANFQHPGIAESQDISAYRLKSISCKLAVQGTAELIVVCQIACWCSMV